MWPRWSHVLAPLEEGGNCPKCRKLWENRLEVDFKHINQMVSAETLMNCQYWEIMFTVNIDSSDKQLGAVIGHDNKPISLFSKSLRKTQWDYTTT